MTFTVKAFTPQGQSVDVVGCLISSDAALPPRCHHWCVVTANRLAVMELSGLPAKYVYMCVLFFYPYIVFHPHTPALTW